ncbi:phosphoglucosamine mutase [Leptolyngbya sp. AN02str]|uniref:phosphoglucosamine mutase n=1 Tax=Leptolyngbya sp. AN02str TaxID=3423363 RepID=UPI003D31C3C4
MVLSPVSQNQISDLSNSNACDLVVEDIVSLSKGWCNPLVLPSTQLFGTDGIRGHAGDLLTPALAFQVGYWAGKLMGRDDATPVIVGQDSRNSSNTLAEALTAGLTTAGVEVWNLGLCPTPAVAYLAHQYGAAGGVMISASHNPPEDNGIKFFGSGGTKLSTVLQARIEASLRNESLPLVPVPSASSALRSELLEQYLESLYAPLASRVDFTGMRIVLDLAWGAAAHIGSVVFRQLGAEVICLHDQPDGDRINVSCGSTHLGLLKAAVLEHQADLGFAFDGDADRALAVDSQGRVVDGDYILYLWGCALKQAQQLPNSTIVTTVMANLGFERAWQQQGGTFVRTAVGDQYVHAEMVKRGAMLGGEQSGHILCPHYSVSGDGLLTALHVAALVQQAGLPLCQLRDESFQTYPQLLQNIRVEDRDRRLNWQQCDPVQQAIAQAEAAMGDQGRILVRASGTEPVIRVMVEAASAELTQHWTQELAAVVKQHLS